MSPASSQPTEMRTRESVSPSFRRSASGTEAWVMVLGWQISVSMPPRLSARAHSLRGPKKRPAASALFR